MSNIVHCPDGCVIGEWGEWPGIDGPVLLCTLHGRPMPGDVYEKPSPQWVIVLDHTDGYPGVIGPFPTEEEAIRAGSLIWELSGDVSCTVVPLYSAPSLGTEPQSHVHSEP